MLNSGGRVYSANGKRQILIADDEAIDREILGEMLEDEYEIVFACDGAETLDRICQNRDTLSLVLLDVLMPIKSGLEVLKEIGGDGGLARIPIVAVGAEREAEIESLKLGAVDVIAKPYPAADVIRARISRIIELSEARDVIRSAERYELTALYKGTDPAAGGKAVEAPAAAGAAGERSGIRLRTASFFFVAAALIAAAALLFLDHAAAGSCLPLGQASARLSVLTGLQTILTVVFLLIVLGMVLLIALLVRKPLTILVRGMQSQETVAPTGVEELRFVTRTYNTILQESREAQERLSHAASHDALTGLFNRGAYDLLMESADSEHMALLLIDVDQFKTINDSFGHAVGDRVLKRVAEILRSSFRSVDILCRIGGDEFAVVMTRVNSSMRDLVINKIAQANEILNDPKDDLPPVSLSVGVAFSDRENPRGDIFQDADTALYRVKKAGRSGFAVYE